jgi:outer membrane protein assembly factor BamA
MRPYFAAFILASAIVVCSPSEASAQKFIPKTIQFQGTPEYSNDELLAAAGLKVGRMVSADEMQQSMNALSSTGLFDGIKYTFNGQDLVFQLKPAANLYSVRLDNLPLTPGPELDAKIHAKLPLYHGKVPSEGTLLDGVEAVLADQLAAIGIKATVASGPYSGMGAHEASAIAFRVATPPILIGEIRPVVSPQLTPKAQEMLASLIGSPYSVEGTPSGISSNLLSIYRDMGYLDAKADATQQPTLVIAPDAVRIPFRYSLETGTLYKVTAIQLAPDMLVSQADFDKQSHVHPGDPADAEHISQNWRYIERQYHNRGYMNAHISPVPTRDRQQHTVSYAVTATSGPVYTMGKISVENVSDDIRSAMLVAWKLPAGAVFNESVVLSYYAVDVSVNPQLYRLFHTVNCKYTPHLNDDTRTVDVVLKLEKRIP